MGILPTMAYVIQNRSGAWEIRESRTTAEGPRSRTLATFTTLTDEVIGDAATRSKSGLDPDELRGAAVRAGAPLPESRADRAAADLLEELGAGRRPRRALEGLLAGSVSRERPIMSDEARSAVEWLGASLEQRGEALSDLLLLADALPHKRTGDLRFPPLERQGA